VRRRPGGYDSDGDDNQFVQAGLCCRVNSNINSILDSGFFKEGPPLSVKNFGG
jgi:hypothetical protein